MWGNGCLRAFQALRCGFESRHSLQVAMVEWKDGAPVRPKLGFDPRWRLHASLVSMQHFSLLRSTVRVQVPGEAPSGGTPTDSPRGAKADAPRSDRGDLGSNPSEATIRAWRNVESHRSNHPEGDIVERKDAALSAREYGFESRCPRQDGLVVQRPSDRVAIAIEEGRPNSLRTARTTPGLQPVDEGSIPSESTKASS